MRTVEAITQDMTELAAGALSLPVSSIAIDVYFEELGLDSLTVVGIVGDLEDRLGVELNMDLLWEHQTIRDLARMIHESLSDIGLRAPLAVPTDAP